MSGQPDHEKDFKDGVHFMLRNLDFGPELTPRTRDALTGIDAVTRQLGIQNFEVVKDWFATMAFVSKTYNPTWSAHKKGGMSKGFDSDWEDLRKISPTPHFPLQHAQEAAMNILVRSSSLPATRKKTKA